MNVTPFTEKLSSYEPSNQSNHIVASLHSIGYSAMTVFTMVYLAICFFIIVGGNGLVLFGLARFKVLRHPGNIFVGILSAVDMTFAVTVIIFMVQSLRPNLFQDILHCQLRLSLAMGNLLASEFSLLGKYTNSEKPKHTLVMVWNRIVFCHDTLNLT